jgi:hypothetical protein
MSYCISTSYLCQLVFRAAIRDGLGLNPHFVMDIFVPEVNLGRAVSNDICDGSDFERFCGLSGGRILDFDRFQEL